MSIVKVQNNEIENNEMKPFNKELLTNMVINKQLDEAKEYTKQYILKHINCSIYLILIVIHLNRLNVMRSKHFFLKI